MIDQLLELYEIINFTSKEAIIKECDFDIFLNLIIIRRKLSNILESKHKIIETIEIMTEIGQ